MQKVIKYTIFTTKWGYFGLAGTENVLLRSCLPLPDREKVRLHLLNNLPEPQPDGSLFKALQRRIAAYFEGDYVNFSKDIPVVIDDFSLFVGSVLTACRDIKFGQTLSYLGLAQKLGQPSAARAVGGALAKNPLPLIIPCHRIIRSDGSLGGFSAPGGNKLKAKMLSYEKRPLA